MPVRSIFDTLYGPSVLGYRHNSGDGLDSSNPSVCSRWRVPIGLPLLALLELKTVRAIERWESRKGGGRQEDPREDGGQKARTVKVLRREKEQLQLSRIEDGELQPLCVTAKQKLTD